MTALRVDFPDELVEAIAERVAGARPGRSAFVFFV